MTPVLGTLKDGRAALPIAMGDVGALNRTDFCGEAVMVPIAQSYAMGRQTPFVEKARRINVVERSALA